MAQGGCLVLKFSGTGLPTSEFSETCAPEILKTRLSGGYYLSVKALYGGGGDTDIFTAASRCGTMDGENP